MCSICQSNSNKDSREEYFTALSELEASTPEDWHTPEDWRTSTRAYNEQHFAPEYVSTPRRPVQRDYQRGIRRNRLRSTSRTADLTMGVAIVPRRIDFDATSDVSMDLQEDMGERTRESLQLRNVAQLPMSKMTVVPGLRGSRMTQYPSNCKAPPELAPPKLVKITTCGKCLRM